MNPKIPLQQQLTSGVLDAQFTQLYGTHNLPSAKERALGVLVGFSDTFGKEATYLFSAPGRTELGGNHTDHQHGCVLAASINLDLLAAVSTNDSGVIHVHPEGYPAISIVLNDLDKRTEEENTSAALVRGVAKAFENLGCAVANYGLNIYLTSNVPHGSGLSSSAAFEVLIATIFNSLFFEGQCSPVKLAQMSQWVENVYFGKPCGLMDQTASSVGGVVAIDFGDPSHPIVEQVPLDFEATGHALCIIDSGADHADLTCEYAAITDELKSICQFFGKDVLRQVSQENFMAKLPALRSQYGDRAVLRALHVYGDTKKAVAQAQAIRDNDFPAFLALANASGTSSATCLQNVVPTGQVLHQELMVTIALAQSLLGGRGAIRVHGGGFGGTAQAFVPLDMLDTFKTAMEAVLGEGHCHVLSIRPVGGIQIA